MSDSITEVRAMLRGRSPVKRARILIENKRERVNTPWKVHMPSVLDRVAPRRGRPRTCAAPSRSVTLTLPETTIEALASVDRDLSRAVVRIASPALARRSHPPAELTMFGRRAVIVVNPTRTLEQRTGVFLIPLPDGR